MKIVLFGKDGQVGRAVQARLTGNVEIVAFGRDQADFTAPASLADVVRRERPDAVINAAAYTAVDAAEDDAGAAHAVNADAVAAIGAAAHENDVLVVHYSTDYVFDGTKTTAYDESDGPHPLSVYGQSKLAGETALGASGARSIILRTSWVYAAAGKNFARTILRLARERESIDIVADQIGAPTPAGLIAEVTARFVAQPVPGLYHLAPAGETSWFGYAQLLVEEAIAAGAVLRLSPAGIRPIAARDYPTRARRPLNSRLDTQKLRQTLGISLPAWQEGVRQLIKTLRAEGEL